MKTSTYLIIMSIVGVVCILGAYEIGRYEGSHPAPMDPKQWAAGNHCPYEGNECPNAQVALLEGYAEALDTFSCILNAQLKSDTSITKLVIINPDTATYYLSRRTALVKPSADNALVKLKKQQVWYSSPIIHTP